MAEKLCPLMKEPCIEHRCRWWIQLLGKHPQKDAPVQEWGCSIEFLPILLIENAQQQRQTGAAVESFRNESVKNARQLAAVLVELANAAAPRVPPHAHPALDVSKTRTIEHKGD